MIKITKLKTSELFIDGHDMLPSELRQSLGQHLVNDGMDAWDVDNLIPSVKFVRTWYSPTVGFTHDCSKHRTNDAIKGCSDSVPVTLITNLG